MERYSFHTKRMYERELYQDPFWVGLEILHHRGEDLVSILRHHNISEIEKIGRSTIEHAMELDENDWSQNPDVAFVLGSPEYDENTG